VAAYRDTFRLLLRFAQERTGKPPAGLELEDLDAGLVGPFLEHLEIERHNLVRTRNTRLAAVHSLFAYAALRHPECAGLISRVLAIPPKRTQKDLVSYLTAPEVEALLAVPDSRPGWADEAARSCSCWFRPACASPSSPGSPSATSGWALVSPLRA
jgi:integrase